MPTQADFQRLEALREADRRGALGPTQKSALGELLRRFQQIAEPAATVASSAIAEPVSGYAGMVTMPFGSDNAAAAVEKTRDFLTYQPRSDAGQQSLQGLGGLVESGMDYARMPAAGYGALYNLATGGDSYTASQTIEGVRSEGVGQALGDFTYEKTGSPLLSSIVTAAPEGAVELAGLRGVRSALPGKQFEVGDVSDITRGPMGKQRGIFAGTRAKNADLDALDRAKAMKEQGASRDEIWGETGWFKDVDDNWKFEIDDSELGFREPTGAPQSATPELNRQIRKYRDMDDSELSLEAELMEFDGPIEDYRAKRIAEVEAAKKTVDPSSQYRAGELVGAEELYDAYPLQELGFRFPKPDQFRNPRGGGAFDPSSNEIKITQGGSDPRSVGLHELQHFVQKKEGFPSGGAAEVAPAILRQYEKSQKAPLESQKAQFNSLSRQIENTSQAEYAAKLQSIIDSSNIKPSSVRNLSDYYRYSDDISRHFGAMPSKPGQARDEWLRNAASYIRRKNTENVYDDSIRGAGSEQLPQLKKEVKRLERQRDKYKKGAREWNEIDRKIKKLKEKSDYELYERISGEAEARNVQARRDMTPGERAAKPPWETLDVPEDELIINRRK